MKIFLLGVQFHPPKKLHNAPLKGCNVSVLGLKLASAASQWTESVIPPSKCKKTCRMDVKSFKKKFVKCTDFLLKVKETSLKFLELSSYLLALLNVLWLHTDFTSVQGVPQGAGRVRSGRVLRRDEHRLSRGRLRRERPPVWRRPRILPQRPVSTETQPVCQDVRTRWASSCVCCVSSRDSTLLKTL